MSGIPREAPCLKEMKENLCPDNNTVMLDRIKNLTLVAEPGNKVSYRSVSLLLLSVSLLSVYYYFPFLSVLNIVYKYLESLLSDNTALYSSNLGFGLLGQGLALSQNVSYEEWMQKSVFDPLGMHDSGFKLTPK